MQPNPNPSETLADIALWQCRVARNVMPLHVRYPRPITPLKTMMARYYKDKAKVLHILRNYPDSRGNDKNLEKWTDLEFYHINIATDRLTHAQWKNLPFQETLARRRREWQRIYPHLQATERVKKKRNMRMQAFLELYSSRQESINTYAGMEG